MQDLSDHLAASGAFIEGHALAGFTPQQQTLISGWIDEEFNAILPPEYRIRLTRGSTADTLPIVEAEGSILPAPGTAVAFVERTPGIINAPMVFTEGFRIERAWIRLRDDTPGVAGDLWPGRALAPGVPRTPGRAERRCCRCPVRGEVVSGRDRKRTRGSPDGGGQETTPGFDSFTPPAHHSMRGGASADGAPHSART